MGSNLGTVFSFYATKSSSLKYLALDVTANCIYEIHCKALDGVWSQFCSQTKHWREKISAKLGFLARGGKRKCYLCATHPPPIKASLKNYFSHLALKLISRWCCEYCNRLAKPFYNGSLVQWLFQLRDLKKSFFFHCSGISYWFKLSLRLQGWARFSQNI